MHRLLHLIRRQWPVIAMATVVTVFLGAAAAVAWPPTYRATSVVMVVRESVGVVLEGTGFLEFPSEEAFNAPTLATVVKGPELLTAARKRAGLEDMPLEEFEDRVDVPPALPSDQVLRISAVHPDKKVAGRIANGLADELDRWVNLRVQRTIGSHIEELQRQMNGVSASAASAGVRADYEAKLRQLQFAKRQPPYRVEVLHHAEADPPPAGPGLAMYLAFSLLFGLLAGVSIAHLRDHEGAAATDGERSSASAVA